MNQNVINFIIERSSEEERVCCICHDDDDKLTRDNVMALKCCHIFHVECGIKSLIETNMTCPMCRTEQGSPEFSYTDIVKNLCSQTEHLKFAIYLLKNTEYVYADNYTFIKASNDGH